MYICNYFLELHICNYMSIIIDILPIDMFYSRYPIISILFSIRLFLVPPAAPGKRNRIRNSSRRFQPEEGKQGYLLVTPVSPSLSTFFRDPSRILVEIKMLCVSAVRNPSPSRPNSKKKCPSRPENDWLMRLLGQKMRTNEPTAHDK